MKVKELIVTLGAEIFNLADGDRDVTSGYAGDFLSFVMGRAPSDCVWFTVMSNVNVCAVASLADVSAVVLCEGVKPDAALADKALNEGVNLLGVSEDIFGAVKTVSALVQ